MSTTFDISGVDIEHGITLADKDKGSDSTEALSSNDILLNENQKQDDDDDDDGILNNYPGSPQIISRDNLDNINYYKQLPRQSKTGIFNNSDTDEDETFNRTMNDLENLKVEGTKINTNYEYEKDFVNSDDGSVFGGNNKKMDKIKLKGILSCIDWESKKISEVKQFVDENFATDMVTLTSNHLDIIASYLNSQKIIYLESSFVTSKRLNMLMIPTIIISAGASVLSGAGEDLRNAALIISCITAFNAFLLAIINYLKLDAQSEAHKISSHQYDKLQGHIMFLSGKTLLFSPASFSYHTYQDKLKKKQLEAKTTIMKELEVKRSKKKALYKAEKDRIWKNFEETVTKDDINYNNQKKKVEDRIRELKHQLNQFIDQLTVSAKQSIDYTISEVKVNLDNEENTSQENLMKEIRLEISSVQDKIKDIKETNQFEVPRIIRYRFPTCYGTNVFTIIKAIDEFKISLTNKLWIIKNNIRYSRACICKCNELLKNGYEDDKTITDELDDLIFYKKENNKKRKKIYETIISLSSAYAEINTMFSKEIEKAEDKRRYWVTENLCFYCPGFKKFFDFILCNFLRKHKYSSDDEFGILNKILFTKEKQISYNDLINMDEIRKNGSQLIEY